MLGITICAPPPFSPSIRRTLDGGTPCYPVRVMSYHKILVTPSLSECKRTKVERTTVSTGLVDALKKRELYLYQPAVPDHENVHLLSFQAKVKENPLVYVDPPLPGYTSPVTVVWEKGVVSIVHTSTGKVVDEGGTNSAAARPLKKPRVDWRTPSFATFCHDLKALIHFSTSNEANTFCYRRLELLKMNYQFHKLLNAADEERGTKTDTADFTTITKVDNHIHAASSMTRMEMLEFMKRKCREEGETVVLADAVTLEDAVYEAAGTKNLEGITTERLDVAASAKMFHRFDNFNDSYNPFGKGDLRTVFMKSSNLLHGRYFAEILRDVVFSRVRAQHSRVAIEPRLSIYGRKPTEWQELASWIVGNRVLSVDPATGASSGHVKWMIQVPRLCNIFMGKSYHTFEEMLKNIFDPIFEATLRPEDHPELHIFLSNISSFDCVDDESKYDPLLMKEVDQITPDIYTEKENPPYSYWIYYLYANLVALNRLREARGMNTFALKPHCGESGQRHHLATCFLLADSINHGIKLSQEPTITYLYYLAQIGCALCPLSNDALFKKLHDSPVGDFLRIGLKVSLGTDDPLQFHNTSQPLLEEYVISQKVFRWSVTDLCEVARNSVEISGFGHAIKEQWLGKNYHKPSFVDANDVNKSNLGPIRPAFREDELMRELNYVVTWADLDALSIPLEQSPGSMDSSLLLGRRQVVMGTQPMLDRLGEAYEAFRQVRQFEIDEMAAKLLEA